MKFELNRLTEYSDEAIIEEIIRVATKLNTSRLTKKDFDQESKVHSHTIVRKYGSWEAGLSAAGLKHLYDGKPITDKMKSQVGQTFTNDDLINELKRVAEILGRKNITHNDVRKHSVVGPAIFASRFGSWKKAIELAELNINPSARRYTDEECFENLYEIWKHYGRQPSFSEINRQPSKVGGEAYIKRFGKWMNAIAAFVEKVNEDSQSADTDVNKSIEVSPTSKNKIEIEDRREIPMGLRFKVLNRDRFKCVLCGDNPAKNLDCSLHVDHIMPWSKGGKTQVDNLRSLCATCNIGRGNRYSE